MSNVLIPLTLLLLIALGIGALSSREESDARFFGRCFAALFCGVMVLAATAAPLGAVAASLSR